MIRITADIDSKNINILLKDIRNALKKVKKIRLIEIRPSNSKGYHMIIWTKYRYNSRNIYSIRKAIGDDPKRIAMDKLRKIGKQTLFYKKTNL